MFQYGIDHLTVTKSLSILNGKLPAILNNKAAEQVNKCHKEVMTIAQGNEVVYGINTGFGPLCSSKISQKDTLELQRNLLLSHSVGVGAPIDDKISKLMMILKVHSLAKGYSGISLHILNRIIWHIENDVIPIVPGQGSVGASGDLAPLSHLFLPLIGEGTVSYKGKILPTIEVLKICEMEAVELSPKAGLALTNGTQFILAHAVFLVDKFYSCLSHADVMAALMIEGLMASKMPFHPKLHRLRPYKGNIHVAERIDHFLNNSEISVSHADCDRVQDPYSLRCVPQVHGSSRSAWLHLKNAVELELNSVTDNPIVFSERFTISGGNFHGQPLALPIDYACLAVSELGNIADRRIYLSLEGKTQNTPKLLMKSTGLNSGFMIVQYTSAALASENKINCMPASADSIPTSLGQEDHVSMGSIGVRKALKVCNNTEKILAIELICAAQAIDFRKPLKASPILDKVHDLIRSNISHATADRIFANDINKAISIIQLREILNITATPNATNSQLFEQY
ncbi:MAG: histidine ammonia-lyase [Saprospiraceae bacterium]